jgi:hypothetical protein
VLLERLERGAHGGPANAEHARELVLGWKSAVLEPTVENRLQYGFAGAVREGGAADGIHDLLAPSHPLADVGDLYY